MKSIQKYINDRIFKTVGGCWVWTLSLDDNGYGRANHNMRNHKAHRLSYLAFKGQIPSDMVVCHECDVRHCVNPEHLFLGTQQENMKDMFEKGRAATGNWFGKGNPSKSKPIIVHGKVFDSGKVASNALNINYDTLMYRVRTHSHINYTFV